MPAAQNKLKKRQEAIKQINDLFSQSNLVNVIHYSCESFYNRTDGSSARITSIAVRNLENGQTHSFSIHQVAEHLKVPASEITNQYDKLEKDMLKNFYGFIERNGNCKWLHWNMRDENYGFPAIAHRFRVHGGTPIVIDDGRLYDLARILISRYSPDYIEHPRMEALMKYNNISAKDALSGADEANAFEQQQYVKLHQSTLRKVDVLANIAERLWNGTLKVRSNWRKEYGVSISGMLEAIGDTIIFKVLGFLTIIVTIIGFVIQIIQLF